MTDAAARSSAPGHGSGPLHKAPISFLTTLRKDYKSDFVRFAKTPSFLVYELWDHLLDGSLTVQS